jgi:hypothetical protein
MPCPVTTKGGKTLLMQAFRGNGRPTNQRPHGTLSIASVQFIPSVPKSSLCKGLEDSNEVCCTSLHTSLNALDVAYHVSAYV